MEPAKTPREVIDYLSKLEQEGKIDQLGAVISTRKGNQERHLSLAVCVNENEIPILLEGLSKLKLNLDAAWINFFVRQTFQRVVKNFEQNPQAGMTRREDLS